MQINNLYLAVIFSSLPIALSHFEVWCIKSSMDELVAGPLPE